LGTNFADVFTDITSSQSYIPRLLTNKSTLFTYITLVLPNIIKIQSLIAVFQSDISAILPHKSVFQPNVPSM